MSSAEQRWVVIEAFVDTGTVTPMRSPGSATRAGRRSGRGGRSASPPGRCLRGRELGNRRKRSLNPRLGPVPILSVGRNGPSPNRPTSAKDGRAAIVGGALDFGKLYLAGFSKAGECQQCAYSNKRPR